VSAIIPGEMPDLDLSFVDRIAVPASVHDTEGRFLHMNADAEQVAGKTAAEMRGRHITDLVVPKDRANVRAHFARAVKGHVAEFETVFVDGSGAIRGARAQHLPLRDGDEIVAVLVLAYEVTVTRSPAAVTGRAPALTPRQHEILRLMVAGRSTEEMAAELTLSVETVRNHTRGLLRALDAHTRLEAIATAHRAGLLSPLPLRPKR
jgi:PAS domain S-box-containing protein